MYKIIYMKADYEPWWMFDDWESKIVKTYVYESEEQYKKGLDELLKNFRENFEHEQSKDHFIAFWNEEEKEYCDSCDEDAQVYHGIIAEKFE